MVKIPLQDTYIGGETPTALQDEISKCRRMLNDKDTRFMVNYSVNDFYTRLIFKIDALPHNVVLPLEIDEIFFNKLSPDVREFLISEGF